jgi:hypothetical protein
MQLSYVIDRIAKAPMTEVPFRHIEIENLFTEADFAAITGSPEIKLQAAADDEALFANLFANSYKIIEFPGCTEDHQEYIRWHRKRAVSHKANTSCEGFGVVLRLTKPVSPAVQALQALLSSPELVQCLADRFGIQRDQCVYDAGIQKYLDGYEISPHPDIRRKAVTFMLNINPGEHSAEADHHTHYLRLRPEWRYVQEFWQGNPDMDRCWVPWDWCESIKQQRANNSIVIFAPGNDTFHAVRARYDHLGYQRTQMYGNLWHNVDPKLIMPRWEDYRIGNTGLTRESGLRQAVRKILPVGVVDSLRTLKSPLKSLKPKSGHTTDRAHKR